MPSPKLFWSTSINIMLTDSSFVLNFLAKNNIWMAWQRDKSLYFYCRMQNINWDDDIHKSKANKRFISKRYFHEVEKRGFIPEWMNMICVTLILRWNCACLVHLVVSKTGKPYTPRQRFFNQRAGYQISGLLSKIKCHHSFI